MLEYDAGESLSILSLSQLVPAVHLNVIGEEKSAVECVSLLYSRVEFEYVHQSFPNPLSLSLWISILSHSFLSAV